MPTARRNWLLGWPGAGYRKLPAENIQPHKLVFRRPKDKHNLSNNFSGKSPFFNIQLQFYFLFAGTIFSWHLFVANSERRPIGIAKTHVTIEEMILL